MDNCFGKKNYLSYLIKLFKKNYINDNLYLFYILIKGNSFNTDVMCSGSYNNKLNMYKIDLQKK